MSRAAGLHDEDSSGQRQQVLAAGYGAGAGAGRLLRDYGGRGCPKAIELAKKEMPDVILLDMLLTGMTGPDVLKVLKKDSSTAAIPLIAFTALSQRNATRLQKDGACAFLEKSTLDLEKGSESFLNALGAILRELNLEVPAGVAAQKATGA